jgi:hypothetical protein
MMTVALSERISERDNMRPLTVSYNEKLVAGEPNETISEGVSAILEKFVQAKFDKFVKTS